MIQNKKRLLFLILIWMLIIFILSSQTREESRSLSGIITNIIISVVYNKDKEITKKEIKKINHTVRKSAHFICYFLSGILFLSFYNQFKISTTKRFLFSQASGIIYAITDEFHQLFVQGRGASFKDVFIDSSGVFIGMILAYFLIKKSKRELNINGRKSHRLL